MRVPLIAGNWKMNLGRADAIDLASTIAAGLRRSDVDVVIFPTALWAADVADHVTGSSVMVGAQNCSAYPRGAHTGELAADQVKEIGGWVILGHSERRQNLGETDAIVRAKLDAALLARLAPILCVGETPNVRSRTNEYVPYVIEQIREALSGRTAEELQRIVIAYEPIWAIGTGRTASADDAQAVCATVRSVVAEVAGADAAQSVRIQYGGSVKAANAVELMGQPDIDGALVGGASLVAEDFAGIVRFHQG